MKNKDAARAIEYAWKKHGKRYKIGYKIGYKTGYKPLNLVNTAFSINDNGKTLLVTLTFRPYFKKTTFRRIRLLFTVHRRIEDIIS